MDCLNEPPAWREDGGKFVATTAANTDFTAEAAFGGAYQTLYDQAGLMLRLDERQWVKAGVEFVDGRRSRSCAVTRDFSDWSLVAGRDAPGAVRLRLRREATALHVEWRPAGESRTGYHPLRLAHFPEGPASVGPMCCSPERGSFEAWFEDFRIGRPNDLSERSCRAPGGK